MKGSGRDAYRKIELQLTPKGDQSGHGWHFDP